MVLQYSNSAILRSLLAALILLPPAICATCGEHGNRSSMIVTTAWLADHFTDPKLVVLGIGQKSEYEQSHIPGSLFLDYMDTHTMPKSPGELSLEMLPVSRPGENLRKTGSEH